VSEGEAEVNITCNQQVTVREMEGDEMQGSGQMRGGGAEGKGGANMIIASIFLLLLFYFLFRRSRVFFEARKIIANQFLTCPLFPFSFLLLCLLRLVSFFVFRFFFPFSQNRNTD